MALSLADKVDLIRLLASALKLQATGGDNRWQVLTPDHRVFLMAATADDTLSALVREAAVRLTATSPADVKTEPKRKRK